MSVWVLNAILIEAMALVGVIGILVTRRTRVAFAVGFNTMLSVTGVYVLTAPPLNARQVIMLVMVLMYLAHMNWLLLFQSKRTAIPKLDAQVLPSQKYLLPVLLANAVGWGIACRSISVPGMLRRWGGPMDLPS